MQLKESDKTNRYPKYRFVKIRGDYPEGVGAGGSAVGGSAVGGLASVAQVLAAQVSAAQVSEVQVSQVRVYSSETQVLMSAGLVSEPPE